MGGVLYHNIGRRYIGMARMPVSRNTFSKPPNSQTKELQWNLFITDKLVQKVLSVIRRCPLLGGFIIIMFI